MKRLFLFLFSFFCFISNIFAYSNFIYAGGDNIGIRLDTDGVVIIGTYVIEDSSPALDAHLSIGDRIVGVNNVNVASIEDILNALKNSNNPIKIGYIRNGIYGETLLYLKNNKTGLYLKDSISGIGTLTYIDPKNNIYGALGHEIIESTTRSYNKKATGFIFESNIHSIIKSRNGVPGEKNASFNVSDTIGDIFKNSNKGIFGTYNGDVSNKKLYQVANNDEIELGEAKILSVIDENKIEEFQIQIIKLDQTKDKTKNIIFKVTDSNLLEKTGGIIQGMSGSPIIQGNKIVGAVTHVVVNDPTMGYGIYITNMLEEGEN